jgi:phosphoglycerate kinase
MAKMSIKDVNLKGRKVLMRVDFNVPLDKKTLAITDDTRIRAAIPTIEFALKSGAQKVVLMSHLGRPDGKVVDSMRLNPVAKRLAELLKQPVKKLDECVGEEVKSAIDSASEKVILLENLRFHAEEEKNDPAFAKQLASLGEIYVNDAFGTAHRAHASTEGVAKYLPAVSGFLLQKEVDYLSKVTDNPAKPFVVILGGAKVSDKIAVIENLLPKANKILIGGGMAYTFLKVQGKTIGKSLLEADKVDVATKILNYAKSKGVEIILPADNAVANEYADLPAEIVGENVPEGKMALDIGPKTIDLFKNALKAAKTIVWNGPLGVCEFKDFKKGTLKIAKFITTLNAITVIGGGDTAAAITQFGLANKMSHVSTGGGASLEFMEGKVLPGIAALTEK